MMMNVLLVDADRDRRTDVARELEARGLGVIPFGDPHFAFLYLLVHRDAVDAVLSSENEAYGLFRRLDVLGPITAVRYADLEPLGGARFEAVIRAPDEAWSPDGAAKGSSSALAPGQAGIEAR